MLRFIGSAILIIVLVDQIMPSSVTRAKSRRLSQRPKVNYMEFPTDDGSDSDEILMAQVNTSHPNRSGIETQLLIDEVCATPDLNAGPNELNEWGNLGQIWHRFPNKLNELGNLGQIWPRFPNK